MSNSVVTEAQTAEKVVKVGTHSDVAASVAYGVKVIGEAKGKVATSGEARPVLVVRGIGKALSKAISVAEQIKRVNPDGCLKHQITSLFTESLVPTSSSTSSSEPALKKQKKSTPENKKRAKAKSDEKVVVRGVNIAFFLDHPVFANTSNISGYQPIIIPPSVVAQPQATKGPQPHERYTGPAGFMTPSPSSASK